MIEQPIWLVLAIPLALIWWRWRQPSRVLRGLRAAIYLLAILAIASPALLIAERGGTVVVLADRSRSMPANATSAEREAIQLLQQGQGERDRLAVIAFGRRAVVEQAPAGAGRTFADFTQHVDGDGSSLGAALDQALALLPRHQPGRILILSDGRWTGAQPLAAARRAAERSIAIDYRHLARPGGHDLAIDHIDAPIHLSQGESFLISAWLRLPLAGEVSYELRRGNVMLAQGKVTLAAGLRRLTFRDRAGESGVNAYTLTVHGGTGDPMPENNTARFLVGVDGPKPLLCLTDSPSASLAKLLRAGSLRVDVARPGAIDLSIDRLANYAGVIVENLSADHLRQSEMQNLAAWVQDAGHGLLMTGGRRSFGPGGYFKSPLDPILPVSMELRQEDRKFSVAIVVALDRSGSMAARVPDGRTKMDLANLGAAHVLDLLSPMDQLGVLAVDTSAHQIARLGPVPTNTGSMRSEILHIRSQGGGIFIDEALAASARMLGSAAGQVGARHIILFADANDSEHPGDYKKILKACADANITVSVIGMGKSSDSDSALLKDIAKRGGGQIYFADDPHRIPELFAQDTFLVARSTFIDQPTAVHVTPAMGVLTGRRWSDPPAVGGYNLCYLRDKANLLAVTRDEYRAPLIATWRAGMGRVACYTGEADGKYTGAIAGWRHVGDMFTSLARWIGAPDKALPGGSVLTQRLVRGVNRIELHLDPDHPAEAVAGLPRVTTLRARPGDKPLVSTTLMHWVSPDTLAADVPLTSGNTALSTVKVPGFGAAALTPMCLPYSPEYAPAGSADRGAKTLARLAHLTGGGEQTQLAELWRTMPVRDHLQSLTPWLALAAVLLLLIEVLERRTGWASEAGRLMRPRRRNPRNRKAAADEPKVEEAAVTPSVAQPAPSGARRRVRTAAGQQGDPPPDTSPPRKADAPQPPPAGVLDALQEARHRTERRMGKRKN